MTMTYLDPRPGDADLDQPPSDVVICLTHLGTRHWSQCIVEDRRPPAARTSLIASVFAAKAALARKPTTVAEYLARCTRDDQGGITLGTADVDALISLSGQCPHDWQEIIPEDGGVSAWACPKCGTYQPPATSGPSHEERIGDLINANRDAPADTVIRAIFESGCTDVCDEENEPGENLATAFHVLQLWYDLDELQLSFRLPTGGRGWVRLIHQDRHDRPSPDDVADYTTNLDGLPLLSAALLGHDD